MSSRNFDHITWLIVGIIACGQFGLLMASHGNYGYFRDEFYYMACAEHLDWGYVDHPPFSILLLAAVRAVFGSSIHAIRLLSTLSGALLVVLTAYLTRILGGKRFAIFLSALIAALSPTVLAFSGFCSMNAFDFLFWAGGFIVLVNILKKPRSSMWILLGVLMGLGFQNKFSMAVFGVSMILAITITSHRKLLFNTNALYAAAIALLLFLPHIIWQHVNEWPTIEFITNATSYKIAGSTPLQFLANQLILANPIVVPVLLLGILWLLWGQTKRFSKLPGLVFILALLILIIQKSKAYYLAPAYSVLFSGAGCAVEDWGKGNLKWLKSLVVILVILSGCISVPMAVPVLSPEDLIEFETRIGLRPPVEERSGRAELAQHFADRFGWENMTATVARVYAKLPDSLRDTCRIVTSNYGEAGAISFFGKKYGLPPVVSGHNNYYLWGPGEGAIETIITVGISATELEGLFRTVERKATISSPYAMPYETDLPVFVCVDPLLSVSALWEKLRMFI